MTILEWQETASSIALTQYNEPIELFKKHVKSCCNCEHWHCADLLARDFKFNICEKHTPALVPFDGYCSDYITINDSDAGMSENLLDYANYTEKFKQQKNSK